MKSRSTDLQWTRPLTRHRTRVRPALHLDGDVAIALLFAMTVLVLASFGLYGALSNTTKRRTHEIAMRIALGANPSAIRWMVLKQALTPGATGMGAGFLVTLGIGPLLRGLLFGISPSDPRVFALTAIVLGTVSVVARYLPSLRASQVNPIVAIRSE